MPSPLSGPWDRRSDPLSGRPRTRATPPPLPSPTTTVRATCQSTPSLFPRSPSTPRRSVSSSQIHTDPLLQQLVLVAGATPGQPCMTVPPTGCCPMDTVPLRYTPAGRAPPAPSTPSPSHVTLYRSTHTKSLCEHIQLRHGGKDS